MKKLFSVLALCLFTVNASAAEKIIVTHAAGTPQILRGGQTIPVTEGMQCQTGDILKTPTPECQADLSMNDLAGCRVLPGSECSIDSVASESMKVHILSGNAILNLKKLPKESTFRVETPTAIASVRGTQFWGRVDLTSAENPVTTFAVREGAVEILVKEANRTFLLEPGQALDIPKDAAKAPSVREALAEEMAAMEQASSVKTSA